MAMNEFNKCIISPFKLNRINNSKQLKIIDCRWYINDKKKGNEEYEKKHIPGAIFFDLEKISDLNNPIPHMLPKKEKFISFLKNNGITPDNDIVIYDQIGFFCSSRVWFTFSYYSFKSIKILNGGINIGKKIILYLVNKKKLLKKNKK